MPLSKLYSVVAFLALSSLVSAAPPSAEQVVRRAQVRAAKEGKNVLLVFHASWCPWCRRLDVLLNDSRFKEPFAKSYVVGKITVRERSELRSMENTGWASLMRRLRGAVEQDVPYLVVLSPQGEKLGDSYRPPHGKIPGNAGFPRKDEEIDAFVGLVRRTGRAFSADERVALRDWFRQQAAPASSRP
jgi:thiol-disulfide isomerase/thioredoxin